jgi:hypothetical protein
MTRQRCAIGVGVLALIVLAVLGVRAPEPAQAAPAAEYSFDKKAAVKVTMRSQALHFEYLSDLDVKRIGGRAFLSGRRVSTTGISTWVYLPVEEVSYIEEYVNVDALMKAHPNLAPKKNDPARPEGRIQVVPDPAKKN